MIKQVKADVLIVGGGSAGFSAAVAVAELGLKAIIVEKNSYLGGKATAAEVGTICGLYAFSKKQESMFIVKGFAKKIAIELQRQSNITAQSNLMGLHYLPYDVGVYKKICEDYIQKNNITVYYNSSIKTVEHNSNVISSVIIKNENEEIEITFSSIIDCSGTSVVSDLIQLPLIEDSIYQAAAQVFTISNVEPITEAQLGMVLIKSIASAIDKKILPAYFDRVYAVQGSVKNGDVSLKIGIPIEVTYQGNNELDIKIKAQEMVHTLFDFLVKHVDVFKKSHLKSIAPEVGFRVGKRAEGNYILLAEDVLQSRKFEDAIAVGAWPIEKWGMDKRVQMLYFEEGNYYQIPLRCLKSKNINNLFFAGRSISADNEAIASARVMGICFQTGYAAGMYACASVLGLSEEVILKKIQNTQL